MVDSVCIFVVVVVLKSLCWQTVVAMWAAVAPTTVVGSVTGWTVETKTWPPLHA